MSTASPHELRLAGWVSSTRALGPGSRAAIWVQGCPFRCHGCVSPHTHAFGAGRAMSVRDLADRLTAINDIEGLTISGGEPFSHAASLTALIRELRSRTTWSFMSYTGYRLADLRRRADLSTNSFLAELDVLVDGLYVESLHTAKRWRGSSNQQVHFLTARYGHLQSMVDEETVALEAHIDDDGGAQFVGIPPRGLVPQLLRTLTARGVTLKELC